MSLAASAKQCTFPELTKFGCTRGPGAHFCAQLQGVNLVPGHWQWHHAQIKAWVLKRVCPH